MDWVVYRLDDNGTRFVVARRPDRVSANELVEAYEQRGHKQTYWAAPADDSSARISEDGE